MDIRSFLQNFSNLQSNKEVVNGNKILTLKEVSKKFPSTKIWSIYNEGPEDYLKIIDADEIDERVRENNKR